MNKFFKLIYINLLNLFDINKIFIAKKDGVKSNLENKTIITGLVIVAYLFFMYSIFNLFHFEDSFLVFNISYIVSSIYCFIVDLFIIESLVFKSADNDILFSLPLSRKEILFSKLFNVYLKGLTVCLLMMLASGIVFYNTGVNISDTQVLMIVISTFFIPLIPIILASIISYFNGLLKVKLNNNVIYKLIKSALIVIVLVLSILVFGDISGDSVEQLVVMINEKLLYIYPFLNLFYRAITEVNLLFFCILIILPILFIYIYSLVVSNKYLKMCSMLKGIRKKEKFKYKKRNNLGRLGGLIRKEFINLFSNKTYLFNTIGSVVVGSLLLFIAFIVIDYLKLYSVIERFEYELYLPGLVAFFSTVGCSSISSMSLEKSNMQILRSLPLGIGKILISKWLVNLFIGMGAVLINGTMSIYFLELTGWNIFFIYVIPFIGVMFVGLSGLLLDYRFIAKNETDDNTIIKQRFIVFIPSALSIILGICVMIFPMYKDYRILLGCYMLIFIIIMIIEVIYMIINNKKLIKGLIN